MKKMIIRMVLIVAICATFFTRNALAEVSDETASTLLISTELLMISQANLAILSLSLTEGNMEHNYTTVEEDRENLGTIISSLDLAGETIKALLKSNEIQDNDIELIRLMDRTNESLKKATNELIAYCDDQKDIHFSNFADDMDDVVKYLDKAGKILDQAAE